MCIHVTVGECKIVLGNTIQLKKLDTIIIAPHKFAGQ